MGRTAPACVLLAVACGVFMAARHPVAAQDADRARAEALARRVGDRIKSLQDEAARLAGQSGTLLGDLQKLEVERDQQVARAEQADADAEQARGVLQETAAKLAQLEQRRIEQFPDVSNRLVELYKQGRGGYVRLLLGVRDLRELGRTTRAVASLAHLNQQRIAEHERTLAALRQEQANLQQKTKELDRLETEAQRARAAADRAVTARTRLIADVDRRRDLNAQLVGELQASQQKLAEALANLRNGRAAEAVSVPVGVFRGALDWPVAGRVLSGFGKPSSRTADATPRNGVEIGAAEGTPVHAVHAGTVSYADALAGYGTLVIVDHGANHFSVYGYLASASVRRDQHVEAGEELGRVGIVPAGPPALYYEMRVDGRSVDPLQWLKPR